MEGQWNAGSFDWNLGGVNRIVGIGPRWTELLVAALHRHTPARDTPGDLISLQCIVSFTTPPVVGALRRCFLTVPKSRQIPAQEMMQPCPLTHMSSLWLRQLPAQNASDWVTERSIGAGSHNENTVRLTRETWVDLHYNSSHR